MTTLATLLFFPPVYQTAEKKENSIWRKEKGNKTNVWIWTPSVGRNSFPTHSFIWCYVRDEKRKKRTVEMDQCRWLVWNTKRVIPLHSFHADDSFLIFRLRGSPTHTVFLYPIKIINNNSPSSYSLPSTWMCMGVKEKRREPRWLSLSIADSFVEPNKWKICAGIWKPLMIFTLSQPPDSIGNVSLSGHSPSFLLLCEKMMKYTFMD